MKWKIIMKKQVNALSFSIDPLKMKKVLGRYAETINT